MANQIEGMEAAGAQSPRSELGSIYREHFAYVYRVLLRLGVPRSAAEDVAQDVFVVVNRKLDTFHTGASLRPWLFGIARRVAADHRKRNVRAQRRLELLPAPPGPSGPDDAVSAGEASEFLRAFLDGLSQEEREAFVLCELEQVTGTDAAVALGVNRNTLYSRLRKLRSQFEGAVASRFGGRP